MKRGTVQKLTLWAGKINYSVADIHKTYMLPSLKAIISLAEVDMK